jgi:S-formylglutathione hydrolase FrmB
MKKQIKVYIILSVVMYVTGSEVKSQSYDYFDTSFYSSILDETKYMRIYLPPGYDNDTTTYPVIYFLHGAYGSYIDLISFMLDIQYMITSGFIHPVIVVGPDGKCDPFAGSMYTNSILYGNYEDYILQEAIPFAENILRTKNSPHYRCMMGYAMGGYGSLKMAIKYPEMFAGIASYAGLGQMDTIISSWRPEVMAENPGPPYSYQYEAGIFTSLIYTGAGAWSPNISNIPYPVDFMYDSMGEIVDSVFNKWKEHDCCRLIKEMDPAYYNLTGIFLACGINDLLYKYPSNTCLADTLDELGINYEFLTTGDSINLSDEMLYAGMHFLDSVMYDSVFVGMPSMDGGESIFFSIFPNPASKEVFLSVGSCAKRCPVHSAVSKSAAGSEGVYRTICGQISLKIYDLFGREVRTLVDGVSFRGEYTVRMNVSDLPAGVYMVRLQAEGQSAVRKLVVK